MNYKIKIKSIIYLFNKNHYMFYLIKKKKKNHHMKFSTFTLEIEKHTGGFLESVLF